MSCSCRPLRLIGQTVLVVHGGAAGRGRRALNAARDPANGPWCRLPVFGSAALIAFSEEGCGGAGREIAQVGVVELLPHGCNQVRLSLGEVMLLPGIFCKVKEARAEVCSVLHAHVRESLVSDIHVQCHDIVHDIVGK